MILLKFGKINSSRLSDYNATLGLLNNLNIHHATEREGGLEWFKDKYFSFASSSVDTQFTLNF